MGFNGEFNVDLMVIEWDLTKKHVDLMGTSQGFSGLSISATHAVAMQNLSHEYYQQCFL